MSSAEARHRFVWYDLMTTDPDAASAFYSPVIGWGTTQWEGGGATPYTMWTNDEMPIGGVMALADDARTAGAQPHWLCFIGTPDVDETAERAKALGGQVLVAPADIPTVGRFAVLADPQGATFAIFKAESQSPGPEGPPTRGEVSWHELTTTDHEAAFEFYRDLFGWEKTSRMDMGPELGVYQMFGAEGSNREGTHDQPLGGMFNKSADMPSPPNWVPYVRVDDINRAVDDVKQRGGQVLNGPMEVPGGDLIAQCLDPQGAYFALHAPKS